MQQISRKCSEYSKTGYMAQTLFVLIISAASSCSCIQGIVDMDNCLNSLSTLFKNVPNYWFRTILRFSRLFYANTITCAEFSVSGFLEMSCYNTKINWLIPRRYSSPLRYYNTQLTRKTCSCWEMISEYFAGKFF